MSKPLSDQVAELERQLQQSENLRKNLGRATHFLEAERDEFESMGNRNLEKIEELEAENTQLRRERDDARAQGISDLNRIHRHRATIRRLEEENAALRAGQGHWPEGDDSPAGEQVPRVISAEEVKPGQYVARQYSINGTWIAGHVDWHPNKNWLMIYDCEDTRHHFADHESMILLEDAPKSEPTVVHDDGGRPWSVEVRPVADPAPRLTVHALNTAPGLSRVWSADGKEFIKQYNGKWYSDEIGRLVDSSYIIQRAPDATLTYPERGDHE